MIDYCVAKKMVPYYKGNNTYYRPYLFTFIIENEELGQIRKILDLDDYLNNGTGISDEIELLEKDVIFWRIGINQFNSDVDLIPKL